MTIARNTSQRSGRRSRDAERGNREVHPRADQSTDQRSHRSDPVARLHSQYGNRIIEQLSHRGDLQTKPRVSRPADQAEAEADRVAEQVTDPRSRAGTEPVSSPVKPGGPTNSPVGDRVNRQIQALESGGQSLPPSTRSFFESGFGRDLSHIRIHTGPGADFVAQSLDAKAFALGRNIGFSAASFKPHSNEGRSLIAHEITHVIQQTDRGSASADIIQRSTVRTEELTGWLSYPIQPNDTLAGIAREFGVPGGWRTLLEVNSEIVDAGGDVIRAGDILQIPTARRSDASTRERSEPTEQTVTGGEANRTADRRSEPTDASTETERERFDPSDMSPSDDLREFVKRREGCPKVSGPFSNQIPDTDHEGRPISYEHEIAPYDDPKGYCTIGWGHLIAKKRCNELRATNEMPGEFDRGITESEAAELFEADLDHHAAFVRRYIEVDLAQHEFDALVSFVYNVGGGYMNPDREGGASVPVAVNRRDPGGVVDALKLYEGQDRRMHEAAMFVHGVYDARIDELEDVTDREVRDGGTGTDTDTIAESIDERRHTVQRGETLAMIAQRYDLPVDAIKRANQNKLHTWDGVEGFMAGATIVIPRATELSDLESASAADDLDIKALIDSLMTKAGELIMNIVKWVGDRDFMYREHEYEAEDVDEGLASRISRVIEAETEAYQNLRIEIGGGETVTVESAYYMNRYSHVANSEGRSKYTSRRAVVTSGTDEWIAGQFSGELARIQPETVDDQFNYSSAMAVEVGKATPASLEVFIQKAYDEGVIENHADPEKAREAIQQWITDVGIGVDCSGLVTHMLNAIRRNMEGDMVLPAGAELFDRKGDPVGYRADEEDVTVRNRNARAFRNEGERVSAPIDLRPGDAGVNARNTHVIIVSRVVGPTDDGRFTFETVESASSADGIKIETVTVDDPDSWGGYSAYDFFRMPAVDFWDTQ